MVNCNRFARERAFNGRRFTHRAERRALGIYLVSVNLLTGVVTNERADVYVG